MLQFSVRVWPLNYGSYTADHIVLFVVIIYMMLYRMMVVYFSYQRQHVSWYTTNAPDELTKSIRALASRAEGNGFESWLKQDNELQIDMCRKPVWCLGLDESWTSDIVPVVLHLSGQDSKVTLSSQSQVNTHPR